MRYSTTTCSLQALHAETNWAVVTNKCCYKQLDFLLAEFEILPDWTFYHNIYKYLENHSEQISTASTVAYECKDKKSFQRFLEINGDANQHQNFIICSSCHFLKISLKSIHPQLFQLIIKQIHKANYTYLHGGG